mgnify:CR=1 FL=1
MLLQLLQELGELGRPHRATRRDEAVSDAGAGVEVGLVKGQLQLEPELRHLGDEGRDALQREESCGGHFREEHQTPEGEATGSGFLANGPSGCGAVPREAARGAARRRAKHRGSVRFIVCKAARVRDGRTV